MHEQYTDLVIPTLAQHLGVHAREIAPTHDLFRDWGLTPLQLVVILLDLERIVALELPSHELASVRTVADLSSRFRAWCARAPRTSRCLRRGTSGVHATRNATDAFVANCISCAGSSTTRKPAPLRERAAQCGFEQLGEGRPTRSNARLSQ